MCVCVCDQSISLLLLISDSLLNKQLIASKYRLLAYTCSLLSPFSLRLNGVLSF